MLQGLPQDGPCSDQKEQPRDLWKLPGLWKSPRRDSHSPLENAKARLPQLRTGPPSGWGGEQEARKQSTSGEISIVEVARV